MKYSAFGCQLCARLSLKNFQNTFLIKKPSLLKNDEVGYLCEKQKRILLQTFAETYRILSVRPLCNFHFSFTTILIKTLQFIAMRELRRFL